MYYWDPVIGPSGMAFYTADLFPAWKGSLFVGGHATNDLVRLTLDGEKVVGEERLLTDAKERIRDVRQGPDGALYLLTDSATARLLQAGAEEVAACWGTPALGAGSLAAFRHEAERTAGFDCPDARVRAGHLPAGVLTQQPLVSAVRRALPSGGPLWHRRVRALHCRAAHPRVPDRRARARRRSAHRSYRAERRTRHQGWQRSAVPHRLRSAAAAARGHPRRPQRADGRDRGPAWGVLRHQRTGAQLHGHRPRFSPRGGRPRRSAHAVPRQPIDRSASGAIRRHLPRGRAAVRRSRLVRWCARERRGGTPCCGRQP